MLNIVFLMNLLVDKKKGGCEAKILHLCSFWHHEGANIQNILQLILFLNTFLLNGGVSLKS